MKKLTHSDRLAHKIAIFSFLVVSAALPRALVHAADVRTAAITSQQAPGTAAGVTFNSFDAHVYVGPPIPLFRGPVLNDAGQVAFRASLAGNGVDPTNG